MVLVTGHKVSGIILDDRCLTHRYGDDPGLALDAAEALAERSGVRD